MKVYCCQHDITWENRPANFARVQALLKAASVEPGSLVLLPEMFACGYSMDVEAVHDAPGGPTEAFLAAMAREHQLYLLGGMVGRTPEGKGRNHAVVFTPEGKELTRYSKMRTFTPAGESQHYQAGSEPVVFSWQGFTVAPFVCYDLRFPEIFRQAVRCGAQLFTVIANWPVPRIHHWVTLLQARAIENQAYVAGVNRCGTDPRTRYNGRSLIVSPRGEILIDAGAEEGVFGANVDLSELLAYRQEFPFLADMRG